MKKVWISICVVCIIAIGVFFVFKKYVAVRDTGSGIQITIANKETVTIYTGLQKEIVSQQDITTAQHATIRSFESPLSYKQAREMYGPAYLQFVAGCQVARGSSTAFTLGNEIMIDNRDATPILVMIGTVPLAIGPYDFGFMVLREKGTIYVDCNTSKGVADLQVQ